MSFGPSVAISLVSGAGGLDLGVAQLRPRLVVVGVPKSRQLPELREPNHGGAWERRHSGHDSRPHVTAGEALDGIDASPEPEEHVNGKWGRRCRAKQGSA
jgi:DNA (cytosine-5)-methyltransferase 1